MAQAKGMAHDEKNPLFSERVREQLLIQRIVVLDGVLDDDSVFAARSALIEARSFTCMVKEARG